jgi:hypothetical protein
MSREVHVRFCERPGVRSPRPTHLLVLVNGTRQDTEALRNQIATVIAPLGLRLSTEKTRVVHLSEELISSGSASSGAANEERTSGTSTPLSASGRSVRSRRRCVP